MASTNPSGPCSGPATAGPVDTAAHAAGAPPAGHVVRTFQRPSTAKLRRTRLDLPSTATDEECAAEEAAASRIRLGLPATATDQECAAKEDRMAPGELAAWCSGRRWVDNTLNTSYGLWTSREASAAAAAADLAAAVRRLALASLLQDRLTEDSPTAEDGVKLLDMMPEVAAAAAKKAVRAVLLHGKAQPCLMGIEG